MSSSIRSFTVTALAALALLLVPRLATAGQPGPDLPAGLRLETGALLFHGNYCGPGNRPGRSPIDALDRACMRHDACSPATGSGRLPTCGCNARLRLEATRVADDRRQPDDLRALAGTVAAGAALLPCKGR